MGASEELNVGQLGGQLVRERYGASATLVSSATHAVRWSREGLTRQNLSRRECKDGTFHELERTIDIVPGASHLFEEPGTLDAVARLAADWFERHPR
jgi:hypothetical protein